MGRSNIFANIENKFEIAEKEDIALSISDIMSFDSRLRKCSNQRITHLLTDPVKEGKIEKSYIQRVPYYCLAWE